MFVATPLMLRRPVIRRPLGTLLIVGATAGVAYKLGKGDAQKIQEHTISMGCQSRLEKRRCY
jgi:hypothetical protein